MVPAVDRLNPAVVKGAAPAEGVIGVEALGGTWWITMECPPRICQVTGKLTDNNRPQKSYWMLLCV